LPFALSATEERWIAFLPSGVEAKRRFEAGIQPFEGEARLLSEAIGVNYLKEVLGDER
jgi:hypothetical protein